MARLGLESGLLLNAVAERMAMAVTDLSCLMLLVLEGPATAGRLAERSGLTTGAITGVVDRLARGGWVGREPDPEDRRRVVVRLVEVRRADLRASLQPLTAAATRIAAPMTAADGPLVLRALQAAVDALAAEVEMLRRPASGPGGRPAVSTGVLRLTAWSGPLQLRPVDLGAEFVRVPAGAPLGVRSRAGRVTVVPHGGWRRSSPGGEPVLEVHSAMRWEIEVTGGANRLGLDLRGVAVAGVTIEGGANRVEVDLPMPVGAVPVRVGGGANRVDIRRPAGTPVSVRIRGGAGDVRLDGVRIGSHSGRGWDGVSVPAGASPDRYDVEVTGGASKLAIS